MWLYHLELSSTAFKDNLKVIKLENQFSLKEEKSEDNSELHIYLFGTSGVWSFWGRNQENLGSEMKETKEGRKIWHIT